MSELLKKKKFIESNLLLNKKFTMFAGTSKKPAQQNNGLKNMQLIDEGLITLLKLNEEPKKDILDFKNDEQTKLYLDYFDDEETRDYAERLAVLKFKNRTPQEEREYILLINPNTRPYAKKIVDLEWKTNRTEAENVELSLLEELLANANWLDLENSDQLKLYIRYLSTENLRDYAARIVFLQFQPERTTAEDRELTLLLDPETAPFAARTAYLESRKDDLTKRETFELSLLTVPRARRNLDAALENYDTKPTTEQDYRKNFLWNDKCLYDTFDTIAELELKNNLSIDEKELLAKLYLKHVADIYYITKEDILNKNYRSVSYNPVSNCEVYDSYGYIIDYEIPVLRTVEDEINKSAEKLAQFYMTQIIRDTVSKGNKSNSYSQSELSDKLRENIQKSSADLSVFNTIKLAILRYFFELAPATGDEIRRFPVDKLQRLTSFIYNEMITENMLLDTSHFYKTYIQISTAFDEHENILSSFKEDSIVKKLMQQSKIYKNIQKKDADQNQDEAIDNCYAEDPIVKRMRSC